MFFSVKRIRFRSLLCSTLLSLCLPLPRYLLESIGSSVRSNSSTQVAETEATSRIRDSPLFLSTLNHHLKRADTYQVESYQ